MKASELIKTLEKLIGEHGDLEVLIDVSDELGTALSVVPEIFTDKPWLKNSFQIRDRE